MKRVIKRIFDSIKFKNKIASFADITIADPFDSVEKKMALAFPEAYIDYVSDYSINYKILVREDDEIEITFTKDFQEKKYVGQIEINFCDEWSVIPKISELLSKCSLICTEDEHDPDPDRLIYRTFSCDYGSYRFYVSKFPNDYFVQMDFDSSFMDQSILDLIKYRIKINDYVGNPPIVIFEDEVQTIIDNLDCFHGNYSLFDYGVGDSYDDFIDEIKDKFPFAVKKEEYDDSDVYYISDEEQKEIFIQIYKDESDNSLVEGFSIVINKADISHADSFIEIAELCEDDFEDETEKMKEKFNEEDYYYLKDRSSSDNTCQLFISEWMDDEYRINLSVYKNDSKDADEEDDDNEEHLDNSSGKLVDWDLDNYRKSAEYIAKFATLVKSIENNADLLSVAQEKVHPAKEISISIDDLMRLMFAHDLKISVQKMGHQFDVHKKEYITVVQAYACAISSRDPNVGDPAYNFLITAMLNMGMEARIDFGFSDDSLYLSSLLEEVPMYDAQIQYLDILHDCCSFVAALDDNVSESETQYLNTLSRQRYDKLFKTPQPVATSSTSKTSQSNSSAIEKLESLIGLDSVKNDISSLNNLVKIQQLRKSRGLNTTPMSYHCVFTGNPGTGKTTVARIVANIYKELGILKKGHLIETDRSGLVAEYVGQTAPKTNAIIDSAIDGVLFIDEAYSLVQGGANDFGKEAISTLLKRMEDDRDRLIVILAGYSAEMEDFINSNSGLQSRFNRYIDFPDYSSDELLQIFNFNLQNNDCHMTEDAEEYLAEQLELAVSRKNKNFGNARFVRNLFEKALTQQANRLAKLNNISEDDLSSITIEDIHNII